jgi:CotH protein.
MKLFSALKCPAILLLAIITAALCSCTANKGADTQTTVSSETEAETKIDSPDVREQTISPTSKEAGSPFTNWQEVKKASSENIISLFLLTTEKNPQLPFNIACYIDDNKITALLPAGIDVTSLIPSFTDDSTGIYLGDKQIISGETAIDFSKPVEFTTVYGGTIKLKISVDIQTMNTGLPSLALTVADFDTINDKETLFDCTVYVGGGDPDICSYSMAGNITVSGTAHGRGNTSFGFPKKGYAIKLDNKTALLGLDNLKDWTLVSNYQDKTLMRNEVAAHLAEELDMKATVSTRSVDLWLNGKYNGTYMLIEKIEVQAIGVPEYEEGTTPEKTGYILEFDGHCSEIPDSQKKQWRQIGDGECWYDPIDNETIIHTSGWIVIEAPSAKKISDKAVIYIYNFILDFEQALNDLDYKKISSMTDLDSFAQWYIVEDVTKSMDSCFWCSCYMYVSGDGILRLGPVWDFDLALGNCNYGGCDNPSGEYLSTTFYYGRLLRIKEFRDILKKTWNNYENVILGLPDYADSLAQMLQKSQIYNFEKWDILGRGVGANPDDIAREATYSGQVELMKSFLRARTNYVENFIKSLN